MCVFTCLFKGKQGLERSTISAKIDCARKLGKKEGCHFFFCCCLLLFNLTPFEKFA